MEGAGVRLVQRSERLSAMGLAEAVRALPIHLRLLRRLKHRFAEGRYDVVVLVDYPGFHLRLAAAAARHGVPVLYYIAPQVWAWGSWRLPTLRTHVRHLAVILPFEQSYFRQQGIPATFVGHPLLDRPPGPNRRAARRVIGLPIDAPVLALFPGSRPSETRRLWPVFREAAQQLRRVMPDAKLVTAAVPGTSYPEAEGFRLWRGDSATVLAAADAGLCKSGTTTLEAALAGMPMVIAYRIHSATYAIARRAVRLSHVGLVNLVAGRRVAPEFLQQAAVPSALAQAVLPLLDPAGPAAAQQRADFTAVKAALGRPGAAHRVAEIVERLAA